MVKYRIIIRLNPEKNARIYPVKSGYFYQYLLSFARTGAIFFRWRGFFTAGRPMPLPALYNR